MKSQLIMKSNSDNDCLTINLIFKDENEMDKKNAEHIYAGPIENSKTSPGTLDNGLFFNFDGCNFQNNTEQNREEPEEEIPTFLNKKNFSDYEDDRLDEISFGRQDQSFFREKTLISEARSGDDISFWLPNVFNSDYSRKDDEKGEEINKIEIPVKIKIQNKLGRKRRKHNDNDVLSVEENKKVHTKDSFDNILRAIKVMVQKTIITLVNLAIVADYGGNQKYKIRKLNGKNTQNVTISFNKSLLQKTMKEYLSESISKKYSKKNPDQNSVNFAKFENKPFFYKNFNDKTYLEIYNNVFINKKNIFGSQYDHIFEELQTLDDYIEELKENNSDDPDYPEKVKNIAKNEFIKYFQEKVARKSRKKNKIIP